MKKPTPEDYNLTSSRVDQISKIKHSFTEFMNEKKFWLLCFTISIVGVFIYSEGEFLSKLIPSIGLSIFMTLWVAIGMGFLILILEYLFFNIIGPIINSDYSNVLKYQKKLTEFESWFAKTQLDFWRSLSGRQFEIELASLLKKHGHTVKVVGGAGDKGIDIILDNNTAVQCKAYKSKVGPAAIRDLIGSMQNANYEQGILASVNGFSKGVYEYNKKNNIELLDSSHYIQMQKELSDG
jgi:hypothetical protein